MTPHTPLHPCPLLRFRTVLSVVIISGIALTCLFGFLWNGYKIDIQNRLEYQAKYPYSCAVPDKLWDACVTTGTMVVDYSARTRGVRSGILNYYVFADNQTCARASYAMRQWDNRHISTTDSDGLTHYIAEGYDSNGVWHRGSDYVKCGADKP